MGLARYLPGALADTQQPLQQARKRARIVSSCTSDHTSDHTSHHTSHRHQVCFVSTFAGVSVVSEVVV